MNTFALLVALATLYSADALTCKACMYMEGSSDHEVMKMVLATMTKQSQSECLESGGSAEEMSCDNLPLEAGSDGWMCGKADVKTTLTMANPDGDLRADMHIISRGCEAAKSQEERWGPGCHPASDFKDQIETGFGGKAGMPVMGPMSGDFCVCEGDNCNSAAGRSALILLVLTMVSAIFFL